MAATTTRPPRLPNGTRVHIRSDHFVEGATPLSESGRLAGCRPS